MRRLQGLLPLLALAACALRLSGAPRVETRLFFGLATPERTVSEEEWQSFLREVVTPRFPEGLTFFDARGQFRRHDAQETVAEDTRMLLLLHGGDAAADAAIGAIIAEYKRRFHQESVLRIDSAAGVSF